MWRELRTWLWLIGLGAFSLWWFGGAPPWGPFKQQRTFESGFDDSWECRHPPKGGPICWKKPPQNIPPSP